MLHAAWRLTEDDSILIRLQYAYVENRSIIESDPIRIGPVRIATLKWHPDPNAPILPITLSPSNFIDRPKILKFFPNYALKREKH